MGNMTRFFSQAYNYHNSVTVGGSAIQNIQNNRRSTFYSSVSNVTINFSLGESRAVDSVYIISSGVTSYTVFSQTRANSVFKSIGDIDYDLFVHTSDTTGSSVDISFTGTNIKIYEVYIMKSEVKFPASGLYRADPLAMDKRDRSSIIQEAFDYDRVRDPGYDSDRKYTMELEASSLTIEQINELSQFQDTNLNFVYSHFFNLFPDIVYRGHFLDNDTSTRLRGRSYEGKYTAPFIIEQE